MPCWTDRSTARTRVAQARGRVALDGAGRAGLSLRAQPRRECRWSVVHPVSLRDHAHPVRRGRRRGDRCAACNQLDDPMSNVTKLAPGGGAVHEARRSVTRVPARGLSAQSRKRRALWRTLARRALYVVVALVVLRRDGQRSPPHPAASPRRQRLGCGCRHQRDLLGPPYSTMRARTRSSPAWFTWRG